MELTSFKIRVNKRNINLPTWIIKRRNCDATAMFPIAIALADKPSL